VKRFSRVGNQKSSVQSALIIQFDKRNALINTVVYNKPTRCNSGSIVFIKKYKYALHALTIIYS